MSAKGKVLVAKLRKQAGVRDAEALAAWIGRFKKARTAGASVAEAQKIAKGGGKSPGKKPETVEYRLDVGPRSYVKRILNEDPDGNFNRQRLNPKRSGKSAAGKTYGEYFDLEEDGLYEIRERGDKNGYTYVVEGGKPKNVGHAEIRKRLKARNSGASVAEAQKAAKGGSGGKGGGNGGATKSGGGKGDNGESVEERLKRQRLEGERHGREIAEQRSRELSNRPPGSVNLGNGIVSRKTMYEAKEDAYEWLEGKKLGAVEIFEITIPGKNREYVAIPKTKANEGIEKKFPAGYVEADYLTESDVPRNRKRR